MTDRPDRQSQDENPKGLSRHGAKAYQRAMEAVFAIPIAGGLGYWADAELGTGPAGLVIGLGLGFITFVLQLVRMRRLVDEIAAEAEKSPPRSPGAGSHGSGSNDRSEGHHGSGSHAGSGSHEDWKPRP